jgi:Ca-activated chloride channel family protein
MSTSMDPKFVKFVPNLKLKTALEYDKVAVGKSNIVHLLITMEGGAYDPVLRQPITLAASLDCSGSMGEDGGKRIEYAKKSLQKLVKHLCDRDTMALNGFSDNVWEIFPATKMTHENKEKAVQQIDEMFPRNSTNLAGGMLKAFEELESSQSQITRAMLFTDGQPNVGAATPDALKELVFQKKPKLARLTTMGYGTNCCKELLESMAKQGGGSFYYIQTPDDCLSAFAQELGGLLSCVAQNIKVNISTKEDVKILEVLNDFDVKGNAEKTSADIAIDDVYSEEKRQILVKLELPVMNDVLPRPIKLGDISIEYYDLLDKSTHRAPLAFKVEYVKAQDAQKDADKEVAEQLTIIRAAKIQEEAIAMARNGNFAGAQQHVYAMAMSCQAMGMSAMADDLNGPVMDALKAENFVAKGGANYLHSNSSSYTGGRGHTAGASKLFATKLQADTLSAFRQDEDDSVPVSQTVPPDFFKPKPAVFGAPPKMPVVGPAPFLTNGPATPKVEPPASLSKKRKKRE